MTQQQNLRTEGRRDELAPAMPFINFFVGRPNTQSTRSVTVNGHEKTVSGSSDLKRIRLIPDFLEEYYEDRLATGRRIAKFVLFDASWDFLETVLIPNHNNVRWSFGWVAPPGTSRADSGLRDGIIVQYQPSFSYQGNRLTIEVIDSGNFKDNAVYTRTFNADGKPLSGKTNSPEKAKISDVVKYLAEEMELGWDVEDTQGTYSVDQLNETNFSFIERVLLPLAQSELGGLKDYEFRVDGAVLVFKRPSHKVRRRYFFGRDFLGTMISFKPRIDKNQIWNGSWSNNRVVGFDPLNKKMLSNEIDVNFTRTQDKKSIPLAKQTFIAPRPRKSTAGRLYITPYDDELLIKETARAKHREVWWNVATADATIVGDPSINVGELIDVVILTNQGDVHYTSGVYRVMRVIHKIRRGSYVTDLSLAIDGNRMAGADSFGSVRTDLKTLFRDDERDQLRWKSADPIDLQNFSRNLKRAYQSAYGK